MKMLSLFSLQRESFGYYCTIFTVSEYFLFTRDAIFWRYEPENLYTYTRRRTEHIYLLLASYSGVDVYVAEDFIHSNNTKFKVLLNAVMHWLRYDPRNPLYRWTTDCDYRRIGLYDSKGLDGESFIDNACVNRLIYITHVGLGLHRKMLLSFSKYIT